MQPESQPAPLIPHVEFKAAVLLALTLALLGGFLAYVLYARGVFESKQRLVLVAEDSEGVKVGMDLTFSGFPIGRVQRIELAADGKARILIDVPLEDARWLTRAQIAAGEISLPTQHSISFRLIEDWYDMGAERGLREEPRAQVWSSQLR